MYIRSDTSLDPSIFNEDACVRGDLARNSNSPDVLDILSYDPVASIRWAVAQNPHTSADTLARLAFDDDDSTRMSVACNPGAPLDVLQHLADADPRAKILFYIIRNPGVPEDVRLKIAADHGLYTNMEGRFYASSNEDVVYAGVAEAIDRMKAMGYRIIDYHCWKESTASYNVDINVSAVQNMELDADLLSVMERVFEDCLGCRWTGCSRGDIAG